MHVALKGRAAQQCLPVSGPGPGSWNIDRRVSLPGAGSLGLERRRRREREREEQEGHINISDCNLLLDKLPPHPTPHPRDRAKSRSHCLASTSSLFHSHHPFPSQSQRFLLFFLAPSSSLLLCGLAPSLLLVFDKSWILELDNLWCCVDAKEWVGREGVGMGEVINYSRWFWLAPAVLCPLHSAGSDLQGPRRWVPPNEVASIFHEEQVILFSQIKTGKEVEEEEKKGQI